MKVDVAVSYTVSYEVHTTRAVEVPDDLFDNLDVDSNDEEDVLAAKNDALDAHLTRETWYGDAPGDWFEHFPADEGEPTISDFAVELEV